MAADDAKLKFLPRHLQRSQPATSSKSKRRVTVEDDNAGDEESDRRSVFERLGPGGLQRTEKPKLDYGHNLKGRNKNEGEKSPDSLRLKFKGSKDRETKMRSQVVPLVSKKTEDAESDEDSVEGSDNWSIDNLEDKKERELELKRQEIQRELKALEDGDDAPIIDLKKSDSSGSDSSPERMHKKKKDKVGKKKDKKKHKKAAPEKELSLDRQGKRKHGSDDEETSPHKKKKKKNKERKHAEEAHHPPPLMSLDIVKTSAAAPKASKGEPQLYEPDSPTSSHTQRSVSPPEDKSKGKKKKKKLKAQADAPLGKSKKLLTPLKKVLKLKKGPASVSSSKLSRSESRDSLKRKTSRTSSSSSSGSSSESPVTKRRGRDPSADDRHERGRTDSKSVERKRKKKQPHSQPVQQQQQQQHSSPRYQQHHHHHHRHRSASSSSSSSSSTTSSSNRGASCRHARGQGSRPKVAEGQAAARQQQQRHKKSKSPAASAIRKEGKPVKKKRDTSESWNRSKDRKVGGGRGDTPQGQHQRQGAGAAGDAGVNRGRQRNRDTQQEGVKGLRHPSHLSGGRHVTSSKDRAGSQQGSKDRLKRGAEGSADRGQRVGREREKGDRKLRKDESRERPGALGGQGKDRDRMDDRGRRMGGGGPGPQQAERSGRLVSRPGIPEKTDRRSFGGGGGGGGGGGDGSGRMGQFSRPDLDRGPMGGRMGHGWEEREGRRDGMGDWEVRGFGAHRDETGRDSMGGGKRRDGGGREERLLPHQGRGGPPLRSGSQDRLLSRSQRDEFGGGQARGRGKRGASQEGDGNNKRDREGGRGPRDDSRAGRGRDDSAKSRGGDRELKPADDISSKDNREVRDRDTRLDRTKGSAGGRGGDGVSPLGSRSTSGSSRVMSKLRNEPAKEDSPGVMRGESSLAAVFDQTETTRASNVPASTKKRPTKSFGGKKSPKKPSDETKASEDKGRLRLGGRGGRLAVEKRGGAPAVQVAAKRVTPSPDTQQDGRAAVKRENSSKERNSPSSQRSADSHHSRSRSSKKSSRSPESRREAASAQDSSSVPAKSPHKQSQSPAPPSPASRAKEKDDSSATITTAAAAAGKGRKREEAKRGEGDRVKGSERGNVRGRSRSQSDVESKTSPGLQERARRKSSDSNESLPKLDGGDIAAAMLGDGFEDGQQDVFSDWSDDDDTFNTIIDDNPRKHLVEDLDRSHGFSYGPRSHHGHDPRGRRRGPATADTAPAMSMHGSDHMEGGMGHRDSEGLGHGRDMHSHHMHHLGAGGQYFGSESLMGGHGDGGHRGQMGSNRLDHESRAHLNEFLVRPALEKNIPDVKIVEDVQKEKPARERRRRNTGEEGYEEISSDENDLDEEGERIPKRTIVSILDIDMTSLMQITKPSRPLSPSLTAGRPAVFQRYKACSVFAQLGLSRRLAGDALFAQVQEACQKQLEQETGPGKDTKAQDDADPAVAALSADTKLPKDATTTSSSITSSAQPELSSSSPSSSTTASSSLTYVKTETAAPTDTNTTTTVIKEEPGKIQTEADTTNNTVGSSESGTPSESDKPETEVSNVAAAKPEPAALSGKLVKGEKVKKPEFKLYADSPADHILRKARAQERAALLGNFGLFRRALTARKDLDIRRQLCKIDSKYDQSVLYPSGLVDPDMFRVSLQLLKQKKASMVSARTV